MPFIFLASFSTTASYRGLGTTNIRFGTLIFFSVCPAPSTRKSSQTMISMTSNCMTILPSCQHIRYFGRGATLYFSARLRRALRDRGPRAPRPR